MTTPSCRHRPARSLYWTLLVGCLAAAGAAACDRESSSSDAGPPADGATDATPPGPEAGGEAGARDGAGGDLLPGGEAGVPGRWTVGFAHGDPKALIVARIGTDGSGYKVDTSFGALAYEADTRLVGRVSHAHAADRSVPLEEPALSCPHLNNHGGAVYLPGGLGHLRWFVDSGNKKVGLVVARPDGTLDVVYRTPGLGAADLAGSVALDDRGRVGAAIRPGKGLVLFRTDKGTIGKTGQAALELAITPAPGHIEPDSLTVVGERLFVVTRGAAAGSARRLWQAPTDGSSPPAQVTLPKVGGAAPQWIDDEVAYAADASVAVVTAGASAGKEDVIALHASGAKVNLSNAPADYAERGAISGLGTSKTQLAVSTKGTYVAYVERVKLKQTELYVVRADGSAKPVLVSAESNITGAAATMDSLHFLDDANLLFVLDGARATDEDLYRYHVPSGKLHNVTASGTTTAPPYPAGGGTAVLYGFWPSPNRKHLYYIVHRAKPQFAPELEAVDLATWKTRSLTPGGNVLHFGVTSCAARPLVFFTGEATYSGGNARELFVLNMNDGSAPSQLTHIATKGNSHSIGDVVLSRDCTHFAAVSLFSPAGYAGYDYNDLYVGKIGAATGPRNVTLSIKAGVTTYYILGHILFSPDNEQVVFFSGPDWKHQRMYAAQVHHSATPRLLRAPPSGGGRWLGYAVY